MTDDKYDAMAKIFSTLVIQMSCVTAELTTRVSGGSAVELPRSSGYEEIDSAIASFRAELKTASLPMIISSMSVLMQRAVTLAMAVDPEFGSKVAN